MSWRLPHRSKQWCCLIGVVAFVLVLTNKATRSPIARLVTKPLIIGSCNKPDPLASEEHLYLSNGLLQVKKDGAHPIYQLMARAEMDWKVKLKRASKTFEEAVREYRRRYQRFPPKGFDAWWRYVVEHNVQLPDEYDQIYHDLEPFWGLQPTELLKVRDELESRVNSYTIGKDSEGHVGVVNHSIAEGSYERLISGSFAIVDLLSDIEGDLPPFRAVLSPYDNPNHLSDHFVLSAALNAAHGGQHVSEAELPKVRHLGWRSACSPQSPAGQEIVDHDGTLPVSGQKTFIYDHLRSMDPCLHPDHFHRHGQFLAHNDGPDPKGSLVPQFTYCSTMIHHDIRVPSPYGWVNESLDDLDWDDKLDERLLWRGRNTGIYYANYTLWKSSHRSFLVQYVNDLNGTLNILTPTRDKAERVGNPKQYRKSRVNPAMMDVAFAPKPIQCAPDTCEQLLQLYPWREFQREKDTGNYKYILDVDGNGWSGRFKRLMVSNSLIFKSTIFPEWYMDRVAPWLHYVPIQVDLSELHDVLMFFRGDANGEGSHEDLARKIAIAGHEWSQTFWRREDMIAYFFRLILEYSRLMSLDRESMTFYATTVNGTRDISY